MACRSVNSLRPSRDDMRRVYRDQARRRRGGVKIGHIIEILDILVPVIPHFFGSSRANANANVDAYNSCNMGYSGEEDMSFHSSGHYGMGKASHNDMGSDCYDFGMASGNGMDGRHHGHGMSYGNAGMSHHRMARADDYGDRVISEEEFERLLDYAEQRNVGMY